MGVEAQPEDENLCGGTPSDTRENSQAFPSTDKHVPPEFEAPVRSHGDRRRASRCMERLSADERQRKRANHRRRALRRRQRRCLDIKSDESDETQNGIYWLLFGDKPAFDLKVDDEDDRVKLNRQMGFCCGEPVCGALYYANGVGEYDNNNERHGQRTASATAQSRQAPFLEAGLRAES